MIMIAVYQKKSIQNHSIKRRKYVSKSFKVYGFTICLLPGFTKATLDPLSHLVKKKHIKVGDKKKQDLSCPECLKLPRNQRNISR